MAIAVEAVAGGSSTIGIATATGFTVTSANRMFVGVGHGSNGPAASTAVVTWNVGQTLTLVTGSNVDAGFSSVAWFELASPTPATGNVVATITDGEQTTLHVITFTGYDSQGAPSTNTGTGTNPSVTVADSAADEIVIALLCTDSAAQPTTEANTLIFEVENLAADTDHNSQYKTATGANTVMAWTNSDSGSDWAASGLAVAGAGGGGASPVLGRRIFVMP